VRITFATTKLEKLCQTEKLAVKKYGPKRARLLLLRLQHLDAAPNLHVMRNLPGRCHELKGDRAGMLSVDLDGPYRLLFVPEQPELVKEDGGLDWARVDSIIIHEVEDTHD
jgi:proteic killer suppression protein